MNKEMKKQVKKLPRAAFVIIPLAILTVALVYVISMRANAKNTGTSLGDSVDTIVGKAIGSIEGMAEGSTAGWESGKEKGLSAEDTSAEVVNEMKRINKLEVLVASVKLNDLHTIGEDEKDYAALYLLKGEVVFTVDLSKAQFEEMDDGLHILLPQPEMEPIIDQQRTEKLAEYQKHFFSGNAEAGLDAYLNSMAKFENVTKDTLANYDALVESAQNAAINQVTQLAKSVAVKEREVFIEFMEEGVENE